MNSPKIIDLLTWQNQLKFVSNVNEDGLDRVISDLVWKNW